MNNIVTFTKKILIANFFCKNTLLIYEGDKVLFGMDFVGINQIYKQNIIQNKKITAEEQKTNKSADTTSFTGNFSVLDQLAKNNQCLVKNISFGGNETDFEQRQAKLLSEMEKIDSLKNIKHKYINKYNIQILERVAADKKLYTCEYLMNKIVNILYCTKTPEHVQIVNKVLAHEKLYNNENLMNRICDILWNAKTPEHVQIVNKVLDNEKLYNNETLVNNIGWILSNTKTPEHVQIVNKILDDEKLCNNENFVDKIWKILDQTRTSEHVKIINIILDNEKLCKSENLMEYLSGILRYTKTPEQANEKMAILEIITSDEKFYNCENLMNNIGWILWCTETPEHVQIVNKILDNEKLCNNEDIMNNLGDILRNIKTPEQAQIINTVLDNEKLCNNEDIMKYLIDILCNIKTPEQADKIIFLLDKITLDKELYNNENIMNNLGKILYNMKTLKQADEIIFLLDKILSDKKLRNNKSIKSCLGDILCNIKTSEQAGAKISVLLRIISDKKLCNNENIMNNIGGILWHTETPEHVQIINKVLDNEKYYNSANLMNNLGKILYGAYTPEAVKIVNRVLDNEKLYTCENLMNNLGNILRRCTDATTFEYLVNLHSEKNIQVPLGDFLAGTLSFRLSIEEIKNYICKNNVFELDRLLQRQLLDIILKLPGDISDKTKSVFPLFPTNEQEYADTIKKLSPVLNYSKQPLTEEQKADFNNLLTELSNNLSTMDLSTLHTVDLKLSQKEFISEFEKATENLSKDEKNKIAKYFGFEIVDGYFTGYLTTTNDLSAFEITDKKTLEAAGQFKPVVQKFTENNFITIENNEKLNDLLNRFAKYCPEIFNQVDGTKSFVNTIKLLQDIVQEQKFQSLSESDKKVLIIATLLNNTNSALNSKEESAIDALFIAEKFGLSKAEVKKVFTIVKNSNIIQRLQNVKAEIVHETYRGEDFIINTKEQAFDFIAFELAEGNLFELTQMLYSNKYKQVKSTLNEQPVLIDITRYFDKLLAKRVTEIKSQNFVLPQTPVETINQHATTQNINGYDVKAVNSSDIPDFYAYVHTPEAAMASANINRIKKFANFDIFRQIGDKKVICTSYIGQNRFGTAAEHGFIVSVEPGKEFVGYGHDIFSLAKNQENMITEYYQNRQLKAGSGKGEKTAHREFISMKLKELMGNISDAEYIQRLDNLKEKMNGKPASIEEIRKIDPKFAKAYKKFLAIDNSNGKRNTESLLRNDYYNEVLVSNPQIIAIYTKNTDKLPEEYLKMAQEQNIPVVILK